MLSLIIFLINGKKNIIRNFKEKKKLTRFLNYSLRNLSKINDYEDRIHNEADQKFMICVILELDQVIVIYNITKVPVSEYFI